MMMDPLSALSVAASVVQFVDFTIEVILKAREIRKDGSLVDIDTVQKTTEELRSWVVGLTAPVGKRDEALKTEYEVLSPSRSPHVQGAETTARHLTKSSQALLK